MNDELNLDELALVSGGGVAEALNKAADVVVGVVNTVRGILNPPPYGSGNSYGNGCGCEIEDLEP